MVIPTHAVWPEQHGTGFQTTRRYSTSGLNFTFDYIDDILVASRSKAEHRTHLRQVFQRLQQHGLVINLVKCQFGKQEIEFLGHHIM